MKNNASVVDINTQASIQKKNENSDFIFYKVTTIKTKEEKIKESKKTSLFWCAETLLKLVPVGGEF